MDSLHPRIRALLDLGFSSARELVGRHEYDGRVQDYSPEGVAAALARVGVGQPVDDPHDEAHLQAFEAAVRWELGDLESHRSNPYPHLDNLDLAGYERPYAPADQRRQARRSHLTGWPAAVEGSLRSLDRVPPAVAAALLPGIDGLTTGLDPSHDPVDAAAVAAHARLVEHLQDVADRTASPPVLGAEALARSLGLPEALDVDLDDLRRRGELERDRLSEMLGEAVARLAPGRAVDDVVPELLQEHPDLDGVLDEARALTDEVLAWTRQSGLAPVDDGQCLVEVTPESRRWAVAMMLWAGPYEDDLPSFYQVTPPEPAWPAAEQEDWLTMFNRTTLPAITVHEVAPGHFTHGRAMRVVDGDVRRCLMSDAFAEGWAHYVEELLLDEGFREDDPRYQAGVALEALTRVVRLLVSIGLHTGRLDVDAATELFVRDAHLGRTGARSEARRGLFDPRYGQYTWGKLEILRVREQARTAWGSGYTLRRFHDALLALGSPPLGLMGTAVERG